MAKIDNEFLDWIDKTAFSYLSMFGGYLGEVFSFDEVIVVTHKNEQFSTAIYDRKKLEEAYAKYLQSVKGDDDSDYLYDLSNEMFYQAEISFDDLEIRIKEKCNENQN